MQQFYLYYDSERFLSQKLNWKYSMKIIFDGAW